MEFSTKAVLGGCAAIVVGALGNGVWQYIIEPGVQGGVSVILNIATLGVQSFKDAIYAEIAIGFHEKQSLNASTSLTFLIAYGASALSFYLWRISRSSLEKTVRIAADIDRLERAAEAVEEGGGQGLGSDQVEEVQSDLKATLSGLRSQNSNLMAQARFAHRLTISALVFGLGLLAWAIVANARASYINSAVAHFEQSMAIVAPHALADEVLRIRSSFARIGSRDDFVAVLSEINGIAGRAGVELKPFEAW